MHDYVLYIPVTSIMHTLISLCVLTVTPQPRRQTQQSLDAPNTDWWKRNVQGRKIF